jgi:adenylate cyclase
MVKIRKPITGLSDLAARIKKFFFPEAGALRPFPFTLIASFGIILGLLLALLDVSQHLEWSLYDRIMRFSARENAPAPDIVVVAVDELSFKEVGLQWPWPRSLHAYLVRTLARAGASVIVLDLIFDQPGPVAEDDLDLREAILEAGNVVLAADLAQIQDQSYSVSQWIDPLPELVEAAAAVGVAKLPYDPDGIIRRAPLSISGRPGLALTAALQVPGFQAVADPGAPRLIRYNGPARTGIKTVSYYQALDPEEMLPEGIFKNKVVWVGLSLATAPEIQKSADHYLTPMQVPMAGVHIHANLLDSLLRKRSVSDPFSSIPLLVLFCLAVSAALIPILYRLGVLKSLLLFAAMAVLLIAIGYLSFFILHVRLPFLPVVVTLFSMLLVTGLYRFVLGILERRLILGAFKHYLAPAIVERILTDPSQLRLGGAQYDVSVLFTDLADFTSVAERLRPEELRRLLSTYFEEMMEILVAERATLDKFIGDAIMVYFGCPVQEATHPLQSCRAALRMQQRLGELNREWSENGVPELKMRIGINSGPVVAGNMGTRNIFNYTVIGDTVNLASRLEGVNKEYGTGIIISRDTLDRVSNMVEVRKLDLIRVKGKDEPTAIYELAGENGQLPAERRELFDLYAEGLAGYRQMEWDRAISAFQSALVLDSSDRPSRTLLERCHGYQQDPPPRSWDGVYVMRSK